MHSVLEAILLSAIVCTAAGRYEPNWDSLDTRPLPTWYDEAKFGIFITWGVYSVPGYGSAWFWNYWHAKKRGYVNFMKRNYPPNFTYADFAPQFTAEFYNPNQWADIIEASGAKYVVLTSKHCDGFTNWPSKVSFNWNSMDVGPKRDIVGELAQAIKKKKEIHFGLYHSLSEWFNPLFLQDKANNFKTRNFPKFKIIPELYELVNNYKPEIVWSDTAGNLGNWTYWKSPEFIAWLYNESPVKDTVVTNDRWGDVECKHGGFYTCQDRYNPGHLVKHKWENCMTIDRLAWTYRRDTDLASYLSTEELIRTMVETISCGGNLLMNIGPTHDGRIIPIFEERLRDVGSWLKVNGEAIYASKPWRYQKDTVTKNVWYTSKKNTNGSVDVYAIILVWPTTNKISLGAPIPSAHTVITLLGYGKMFEFERHANQGITFVVPKIPFYEMPCKWAWVFKLTNVLNM